jgi:hypothetical protein
MTEQINDQPQRPEIRFGDSAKWHIVALCEDRINIAEAAQSFKFLLEQITQDEARDVFMNDLKAFILRTVAQTDLSSDEGVNAKGEQIFEDLKTRILSNKSSSQFTRDFGISMQKVEQRVGEMPQ